MKLKCLYSVFLTQSIIVSLSSSAVIRESSSATSSWLGHSLRLTGNYLPLRGMAGLAMEMGVPGSEWLKDTLDWREDVVPDFKEELLFAAGGFMGMDECARKFSCRMGKRISRIPGLESTSVFLSGALPYTFDLATYLPEYMGEHVMLLRDSVLYSEDCEKYACSVH